MEIVGSVAPEEVPAGARRNGRPVGLWVALAQRAIADHESGRVTVVKLANEDEYKKMRNGTAVFFRDKGYKLDAVTVEQGTELRVFMELHLRDKEPA